MHADRTSQEAIHLRRSVVRRSLTGVAIALSLTAFSSPALAEDALSPADEIRLLRETLEAERQARVRMEARLAALERTATVPTRAEATSAVERYLAEREHVAVPPPEESPPKLHDLIDVALILSVQLGTSTATDDALSNEIALGDHDPHVRGANVRNEELIVSGDVDGSFHAVLDVVYVLDEEGESRVELEEAYGLTTSLPAALEVKVGQFLTEFGRENAMHPHEWEFDDTPVILARVLGPDGWRGQGARVSWKVPTRCSTAVTLLAGFQNPIGETQASFFGEPGEQVGAYVLVSREVSSLSDLAYHARVEAGGYVKGRGGSTLSWLTGLSGGFGPNATGPDGFTRLYGADAYVKWKPRGCECGWPWVSWQAEVVVRDYHADDQVQSVPDGMGGFVDVSLSSRRYVDWGFYTQVVYGFARPWSVGLRLDYADSDGAYAGAYGRASMALTYYPSESSRIRLQLQYDDVEGLHEAYPSDRDANFSVWLGFELKVGHHDDHDF